MYSVFKKYYASQLLATYHYSAFFAMPCMVVYHLPEWKLTTDITI